MPYGLLVLKPLGFWPLIRLVNASPQVVALPNRRLDIISIGRGSLKFRTFAFTLMPASRAALILVLSILVNFPSGILTISIGSPCQPFLFILDTKSSYVKKFPVALSILLYETVFWENLILLGEMDCADLMFIAELAPNVTTAVALSSLSPVHPPISFSAALA